MKNPQALAFIIILAFHVFSIARAQERAPHGLAYETPLAFSPAAVDFFHPKTQNINNGSPLPLAAQIDDNRAQESVVSASRKDGRSGLGAGGIAGIVLGFVFVVAVAMAGFYVFVARRANADRSNFIKPVSSA